MISVNYQGQPLTILLHVFPAGTGKHLGGNGGGCNAILLCQDHHMLVHRVGAVSVLCGVRANSSDPTNNLCVVGTGYMYLLKLI